jgi:hypothetical protein
MLIAKAFPRVEESPSILDADVTLTLPQHPLVLMEALSLWEDIRSLLDPPGIRRIDVWAAHGYMEHSTTVGFLLHLGEVCRKEGKVVRVRPCPIDPRCQDSHRRLKPQSRSIVDG